MCKDNNNQGDLILPSVNRFAQFQVYWAPMDKFRPVVIVSNNWFNTISNSVLVASITSTDYDAKPDREYDELMIKFSMNNSNTSSVKLNSLKFLQKNCIYAENYIGMITDVKLQAQIVNMMKNIMDPGYNADHLTYEYISGKSVAENNIKTEVSHPQKNIEVPVTKPQVTDSEPITDLQSVCKFISEKYEVVPGFKDNSLFISEDDLFNRYILFNPDTKLNVSNFARLVKNSDMRIYRGFQDAGNKKTKGFFNIKPRHTEMVKVAPVTDTTPAEVDTSKALTIIREFKKSKNYTVSELHNAVMYLTYCTSFVACGKEVGVSNVTIRYRYRLMIDKLAAVGAITDDVRSDLIEISSQRHK